VSAASGIESVRPFQPPIVPMEARVADDLPRGPGWSYEPKWDGFRVVMWSPAGGEATDAQEAYAPRLDSRNGKALLRYFPELEPALGQLPPGTVADGEVVVVTGGKLDFDALQNRIHPAASRIRRLAEETPASLALFDLLALEGADLRDRPLRERRAALERLAARLGAAGSGPAGSTGGAGPTTVAPSRWLLSPSTTDLETARRWFRDFEPAGFDGIVAKALDRPYAEGRREMVKVKHRRTVDCVVGGYRLHKDGRRVGSILLGLYDPGGALHFIGHCSSFSDEEAAALLVALQSLRPGSEAVSLGPPAGFGEHVRHPGAPSRWSAARGTVGAGDSLQQDGGADDYIAVTPLLVIEVSYDQLTGDRFRHATRFERWRPDKDPRRCTMDQLERPQGAGLQEVLRQAGRTPEAAGPA
jgi:ATP-dependent DNA ligase